MNFAVGERVAYTIPAFGEATATVLGIRHDGAILVWPDRWGTRWAQSHAAEALSPLVLRKAT